MVKENINRDIIFDFPGKEIISKEMPRYPNIWFFINADIINHYNQVIYFMTSALCDYGHICDDFNSLYHLEHSFLQSLEGADLEARLRNLQPYREHLHPLNSHDHQLHVRYYFSNLIKNKSDKVPLKVSNKSKYFYCMAMSVHYEISTENKNHPFLLSCPVCGKSGQYSDTELDVNNLDKDICKKIHDPLGVELLLKGTIRDKEIYDQAGKKIELIKKMRELCDLDVHIFQPKQIDIPLMGCVLIDSFHSKSNFRP